MAILTERQTWRRAPAITKQIGIRLTPTERENVRQAVIYLCGRYATRAQQVEALGMSEDAINKARSRNRAQTYALACVVARVANVPVEKVVSGLYPGDRCPHCGGTGRRSQVVTLTGRPATSR